MLEHHIQKHVVYSLALADSLRFSDLKPDDIENKLFDYHLKKTIASGLVAKTGDGEYALTPLGRRVGKDALKKNTQLIDRAYSVLFMVVRRTSDGAWMLVRRKTHPLLGRVGFINAQPELDKHVGLTAREQVLARTGLDCEFTVRGSGYLRMYAAGELESFTHFTLLECLDAKGELQELDELADYFWEQNPDFTKPEVLPTLALFAERLAEPGLFFIEQDVLA